MRLVLICSQCGENDWIATELAGEPMFQCDHCKTYALPKEIVISVEKMKTKMINIKCPYCGSSDMTVDVDICVTGDLQTDGTIKVRPCWTPDEELNAAVSSTSSKYIEGFCGSCGAYCAFNWGKGFIKGDDTYDV